MKSKQAIRTTRSLLVLLFLTLSAQEGLAQYNTAEIRGRVTDNQGSAIPGASVTAVQVANGSTMERLTDSEGQFLFPALIIGEYRIAVAARGFK